MGRDDDKESGAEADQDVAVTEPVVRLDRPVTTLQSGQSPEFESRLDYFLSLVADEDNYKYPFNI